MSAVRRCPRRAWTLLAALLAASLLLVVPACALLGSEEEPPSTLEELPVVDDSHSFDPAQAVDDDDDLEREGGRGAKPTDADAFAGSDSRAPNRADAGAAAPASATRAGDRGASRAAPAAAAKKAAPGKEVPDDEHVASPTEVERLQSRRRADFEAANRGAESDAAAKTELATNPPPEEIGPAKSVAWTVLDYTLEGLLLAIGALGITALLALVRRFPKTVVLAVAGGLALLAVLTALEAE